MPKRKSQFDYGSPSEDYNEYMKQYMKREVLCPCGMMIKRSTIPSHNKSNKHQMRLTIASQTSKLDIITKALNNTTA
jgi:hypothetical protein